jgi:hypothetical protein
MIKDIPQLKVEDIAVAIIKERDTLGNDVYNAYLINLKEVHITNVMVSSKGYGLRNGEEIITSTLRHFLEDMPQKSYCKIEPIMEELFQLNNEFLLSFFQDGVLFDKKFTFPAGIVKEENEEFVPLINKSGILINS